MCVCVCVLCRRVCGFVSECLFFVLVKNIQCYCVCCWGGGVRGPKMAVGGAKTVGGSKKLFGIFFLCFWQLPETPKQSKTAEFPFCPSVCPFLKARKDTVYITVFCL